MENFIMTRGDTLAFGLEIQGLEGQDLEEAYFSVKAHPNDEEYIFQRSLGDGLYKIDETHYGVRVRPEFTAELEPNIYYYDLQIGLNDDIYTILGGKLTIKKGIKED